MPYTVAHKRNSREKILKSAMKLFSRRGFDKVSIDDLMNDAGMTRGAFYAHFKTKSELYEASLLNAPLNSRLTEDKPDGMSDRQWLKILLSAYLSRQHIDKERAPCPLAFLVTDVANREPKVRSAYTQVYKGLVDMIKTYSDKDDEIVFAITAMMIGSVSIGRSLEDPMTVERLLTSSRKIIESLI